MYVSVWMLTIGGGNCNCCTESRNLVCTDLLMNSDHKPKTTLVWPTSRVKPPPLKKIGRKQAFSSQLSFTVSGLLVILTNAPIKHSLFAGFILMLWTLVAGFCWKRYRSCTVCDSAVVPKVVCVEEVFIVLTRIEFTLGDVIWQ